MSSAAPRASGAPGDDLVVRVAELEEQLAASRDELAALRRRPRLGLVWEDQREAVEDQMERELPVLTRDPARSVGEDARPHLLIEGDNLHALACLQYTHAGAVDVIYIDPPYNTGSKDNKDFRYNDHYVNSDDDWRHSKWLSFMDRRIRLAKELLAPGGFLAVSIDDNEMAHLRLLLDAHFGETNLVSNVVVESGNPNGPKTKYKDRTIFKVKEYLLIYRRPGDHFRIRPRYDETYEYDKEYSQVIDGNTITTKTKYQKKHQINDTELIERCLAGEVFVYRSMRDFDDKTPQFAGLIKSGELKPFLTDGTTKLVETTTQDGTALYLRYQDDQPEPRVDMIKPLRPKLASNGAILNARGDLWKGFNREYGSKVANEGGVSFPNGKKSVRLLQDIIDMHPNRNAVVLDFFAGSGSTAHAVASLNDADGGTRQCILVTNNEGNICTDVTYPRVKGVLSGKLANGKEVAPLPGALRYYYCEFVPTTRNRDAMLRRLAQRAGDLIAIRENTYDIIAEDKGRYIVLGNGDRRVVVWCGLTADGLAGVLDEHETPGERALYLFSFDETVDPAAVAAHPAWHPQPLPEPLRAALERAHRRITAR